MGIVDVNVSDVLSGIGTLAKDVRTAITGKDPGAEAKLAELDDQLALAQLKVNEIEAASTSVFVSGWRPFIGWLCGVALGIQFIYMPIFTPESRYDFSELISLVIAMLGIGALRTYEKTQNVSK